MQRWDDGSGRITVIRSKTDVEAQGAAVAITPAGMKALDVIRPAGAASSEKVFGLSESQIARRVKGIAKAAGLADWEFFSGHSGRVGMARRMARGAPTHEIERQGGPLETGRRHGRPIHPRRDRRLGAQVFVSCTRLWNGLQKPAGICVPFRMLAEMMSGSSRHVSLRSLGFPTLRHGGR